MVNVNIEKSLERWEKDYDVIRNKQEKKEKQDYYLNIYKNANIGILSVGISIIGILVNLKGICLLWMLIGRQWISDC